MRKIFIGLVILIMTFGCKNNNELSSDKQIDSLYAVGCQQVNELQIDQAQITLHKIHVVSEPTTHTQSIIDSAHNLIDEIHEFKVRQISFRHLLSVMSNKDYILLNKLDTSKEGISVTGGILFKGDYFQNNRLNKEFIKIMYDNRNSRNKYIAEEKEQQRKAAIDEKKRLESIEATKSSSRKDYGSKLRQNYLDQNLDIKVNVSGTNNTTIELSFALFNDVWANKISKGTLIDEIQSLGFKKLRMTDGYDYAVAWKF